MSELNVKLNDGPAAVVAAPIGEGIGLRMIRSRNRRQNVLETIGWTPLIRISRVTRGIRTPVYAKAEFFNASVNRNLRLGGEGGEAPTALTLDRQGRLLVRSGTSFSAPVVSGLAARTS